MHIVAAGVSRGKLDALLDQVLADLGPRLDGRVPDLGLLFLTNHFEDEANDAAERVQQATNTRVLIGCTGEGVIGPEHEYEQEPALSLWLAAMPGCLVQPFQIANEQMEEATTRQAWLDMLNLKADTQPAFLALGDPFSADVNALLDGFNEHFPGRPVIGGMASGAEAPEQAALVLNDWVYHAGVVGVAISGEVEISTVVSQGCRPVGKPFVITKGERNIIHQLGGRKPLEVLHQIFEQAPKAEQKLMQEGIFIGRVIDERRPTFERGDFLIRHLVGADENSGAIAIGDHVRMGTTVQFHVRDATTAHEDLRTLLDPHRQHPPAGALLFSCNGRGTRLFDRRDHDITTSRELLGSIPVAGFFCAGELGPVGGRNFIHGHTASVALFRPRFDQK